MKFGKNLEHEYNLADLLRRPDVNYAALMSLEQGRFAALEAGAETAAGLSTGASTGSTTGIFDPSVVEQIEISAKYAGYIDRQRDEVQRAAQYEHLRLPEDLDYMAVAALSIEARQKLTKHRPETLGLASRISGITPASISLLLVHLKKRGYKQFAAQQLATSQQRAPNAADVPSAAIGDTLAA